MSPRKVRAYHRQIARLQAARDMRLLDVVTAPHVGIDFVKQLRRDLETKARGERKREIVITSNADLKKFLRGGT